MTNSEFLVAREGDGIWVIRSKNWQFKSTRIRVLFLFLKMKIQSIKLSSYFAALLVILISLATFMPLYFVVAAKYFQISYPSIFPVEKFDTKEWIAVYAALFAMAGWVTASIIQLRNSVKQHTINTLLQSRMSTAFQAKADAYQKYYPTLPIDTPMTNLEWQDASKSEAVSTVRYLLNYFEFLAIGIKAGDFDEFLMRDSLRKILCSLVERNLDFIKFCQSKNSRSFSNLLNLYNFWTIYQGGSKVETPGRYRCEGCERKYIKLNAGEAFPFEKHHKHGSGHTKVEWRLIQPN